MLARLLECELFEAVPYRLKALFLFFGSGLGLVLLLPGDASAIQVHPAPEGLYAHQIAHVFFIASMAFFAFWLEKTRLVKAKGWRYIQLSSFWFILWNIGAMLGHVIDSFLEESAFVGAGWSKALVVEEAIAPYLYYVLKMDHLICVPAMVFLLLGLKKLNSEVRGRTR
jgi:hypothetical protein